MSVQCAIIGNAVVDIFRSVEKLPALDTSTDNMRVIVLENSEEVGGNAMNAALVLGKHSDATISVLTALADDRYGQTIRSACAASHIHLISANTDTSDATGSAIVLHERSTNRTMFLYHPGCNERLDVPLLRQNFSTLSNASLLHICGFGGLPGIDRDRNLTDFIAFLKELRAKSPRLQIILDVMFLDDQTMRSSDLRNRITPLLEQIDFFVPNELEALQYSKRGESTKQLVDVEAELAELACEYNEHVRIATIIKRGPRGVTIFPRNGEPTSVSPTISVDQHEIIDTVGAGDAWCAGFIEVLCQTEQREPEQLEAAARRGNELARQSLFARGGNAAFFR